jgi:hypothetical protein
VKQSGSAGTGATQKWNSPNQLTSKKASHDSRQSRGNEAKHAAWRPTKEHPKKGSKSAIFDRIKYENDSKLE